MRGARIFFMNGLLLSIVTVILRAISVSFNAYVTRIIGEEALGLFTLVMSVYTVAVTFATSSVNLAAVRMTSETLARLEVAEADTATVRAALKKDMIGCIKYSLFFGFVTGIVVFILSPVIALRLLGDVRTVLSLRVFSVSLPAIALASALSGYFTGINKVYKNAIISIAEQLVKMAIITLGLIYIAPRGIEYACVAVVGGGAVGEGASLLSSLIFYYTDKIKKGGKKKLQLPKKDALEDAASIALPCALGSYVRSSLVCAEHIAIPAGLRKHGSDSSEALASYGVLHGMVYPLIFFPSSILASFASLLVPELSAAMATGNKNKVNAIAEKVLRACLVFSFLAGGIFITFSDFFGYAVYDSGEAGKYISLIAPLIPVMYLDTSVDFMLKGLGQQVYTMAVNIADAFISLILVLILVPKMGISGYILAVYILEIFNCALSLGRLVHITDLRVKISWIVKPLFSVLISCTSLKLMSIYNIAELGTALSFAFVAVFSVIMFRLTNSVSKNDLLYFKSIIKITKNR